jgi:hypothetical protein
VDYFTPQLYWPIAKPEQSFPALMRWWGEQNTSERHLWLGLYTSRVKAPTPEGNGLQPSNAWTADEILAQVDTARAYSRASGTVHFSMKAFMNDQAGVGSRLLEHAYGDVALVPPSPWLSKRAPSAPAVRVKKNAVAGSLLVSMSLPKPQVARWYLVQSRTDGVWSSRLVTPSATPEEIMPNRAGVLPDRLVVVALDRAGVASPAVRLVIVR